jgi:hypothetical protein
MTKPRGRAKDTKIFESPQLQVQRTTPVSKLIQFLRIVVSILQLKDDSSRILLSTDCRNQSFLFGCIYISRIDYFSSSSLSLWI